MGKRDLLQQSIYLEPEKARRLDDLSAATRIPKASLMREAIDDLLGKYGEYGWVRERLPDGRGNRHELRRKRKP